jgi:hypothetical protein
MMRHISQVAIDVGFSSPYRPPVSFASIATAPAVAVNFYNLNWALLWASETNIFVRRDRAMEKRRSVLNTIPYSPNVRHLSDPEPNRWLGAREPDRKRVQGPGRSFISIRVPHGSVMNARPTPAAFTVWGLSSLMLLASRVLMNALRSFTSKPM